MSNELKIFDGELLTVSAAAVEVKKSPSTLWRWAKAGKIAHVRDISGRIYFRREDLDRVWKLCPATSEGVV